MTDIDYAQLPLKYRLMRRGLQALSYTIPPAAARISLEMFSTPTRRPVKSGKTKRILEQASVQMMPYDDPILAMYRGLKIAVHTWGNPDAPAVLLAHGWEGQAGSWREFVPALLDAGFYVVAFDAPGHGKSSGNRANLLLFMNTIRAVNAKYGPFVGVVGHSLGGIAALLVSAEEPKIQPQRIVTIAAPVRVTSAFESFTRFWGLPKWTLNGMYRIITRAVNRTVASFAVDRVADHITQPLLIIHDTDDTDVGYHEGETMARLIPRATLHTTSGLGHQMILRDQDIVTTAISFLQQSD